jgi:predicted SprT family Zn-dependent metalloprotease
MTLCAGTCKYEGFQSSTITLSEPLLKYRSANELKETLLHEMVHAYLFIKDPESCRH